MTANPPPDAAQLFLAITTRIQPAHLYHAGSVLQLFTHFIKEPRSVGERKIVPCNVTPLQFLDLFERGIELVQYDCRDLLEPAMILAHLRPLPNTGTLQIV